MLSVMVNSEQSYGSVYVKPSNVGIQIAKYIV